LTDDAGSALRGERIVVRCERMTLATRDDARRVLGAFLGEDAHYRASAAAYGDGGGAALDRALALFLARPELGFVWLAYVEGPGGGREVAGACVVCHAISTARGSLVAKLDDVHVDERWQRRGVGGAMLDELFGALRAGGATRVDTSCHRDNAQAWAFYARRGFRALDEERIARLLAPASDG
jgi:ribosomal protein S18 acetylase RimI-like enzyme